MLSLFWHACMHVYSRAWSCSSAGVHFYFYSIPRLPPTHTCHQSWKGRGAERVIKLKSLGKKNSVYLHTPWLVSVVRTIFFCYLWHIAPLCVNVRNACGPPFSTCDIPPQKSSDYLRRTFHGCSTRGRMLWKPHLRIVFLVLQRTAKRRHRGAWGTLFSEDTAGSWFRNRWFRWRKLGTSTAERHPPRGVVSSQEHNPTS